MLRSRMSRTPVSKELWQQLEPLIPPLGVAKNTANLMMLFALSNLWMARKRLLNMGAQG